MRLGLQLCLYRQRPRPHRTYLPLQRASVRSFSNIAVLAVAVLAGCKGPVTPPPPTAPTLAWTSDGNPGVPNCTTTQTTGCLTTYTLTDTTTNTVIAANIPASALSYTISTLPIAGTHV